MIPRQNITVIAKPQFEPVTLAEAKLWCQIEDDQTDQDAMVLMLITAMREYAEALTGRAFVQRTLELRMDRFPPGPIELPYAPLRSVTSISYVDAAGVLQTLDASPTEWQEDTVSEPGRVAPVSAGWPATRADELGAVRIRYIAGYENANAIPKLLKLWIEARIRTLYDNRNQIVSGGNVVTLPREFVDGLLDGLRVRRMFA